MEEKRRLVMEEIRELQALDERYQQEERAFAKAILAQLETVPDQATFLSLVEKLTKENDSTVGTMTTVIRSTIVSFPNATYGVNIGVLPRYAKQGKDLPLRYYLVVSRQA